MSKKHKSIIASEIISACPSIDLIDVDDPIGDESVIEYVRRVRDCNLGGILGNDSIFQYIMFAASDAQDDPIQLLSDLIRGMNDLNSVAIKVMNMIQRDSDKESTNETQRD